MCDKKKKKRLSLFNADLLITIGSLVFCDSASHIISYSDNQWILMKIPQVLYIVEGMVIHLRIPAVYSVFFLQLLSKLPTNSLRIYINQTGADRGGLFWFISWLSLQSGKLPKPRELLWFPKIINSTCSKSSFWSSALYPN